MKTNNNLTQKQTKFVFITSIGSALEFYDFIIFVYLANVMAPIFFPSTVHINSLLATFGVFTVGYLARPIGGLIFSHFGDLYGRKKVFYLSIMLMAIPSLLIGLLPGHQSIGILAPILLILLRIIQGCAIGGETPGMITYIFELVDIKKRGIYISLLFSAAALSTFIAQGIIAFLHLILSDDTFELWGWRIPFILGALLGIVGGYLRRDLIEPSQFNALESKLHFSKIPLVILFKNHLSQLIKGIIILAFGAVCMLLIFVYMPVYLVNFKTDNLIDTDIIQIFNSISLLIFFIFIIVFGFLSDITGRKYIIILGSLLIAVFTYPIYHVLLTQSAFFVLICMLSLSFIFAMITSSYGTLLAEMFPQKVRYTGVGLIYNLGFSIFGGTAPLLATYLIKISNNPMMPAIYMLILAILGCISTILVKINDK